MSGSRAQILKISNDRDGTHALRWGGAAIDNNSPVIQGRLSLTHDKRPQQVSEQNKKRIKMPEVQPERSLFGSPKRQTKQGRESVLMDTGQSFKSRPYLEDILRNDKVAVVNSNISSFDKQGFKLKFPISQNIASEGKDQQDSTERLHEGFKKHSIIECLYGSKSSLEPLSNYNLLQNPQQLSQKMLDELDIDSMSLEERKKIQQKVLLFQQYQEMKQLEDKLNRPHFEVLKTKQFKLGKVADPIPQLTCQKAVQRTRNASITKSQDVRSICSSNNQQESSQQTHIDNLDFPNLSLFGKLSIGQTQHPSPKNHHLNSQQKQIQKGYTYLNQMLSQRSKQSANQTTSQSQEKQVHVMRPSFNIQLDATLTLGGPDCSNNDQTGRIVTRLPPQISNSNFSNQQNDTPLGSPKITDKQKGLKKQHLNGPYFTPLTTQNVWVPFQNQKPLSGAVTTQSMMSGLGRRKKYGAANSLQRIPGRRQTEKRRTFLANEASRAYQEGIWKRYQKQINPKRLGGSSILLKMPDDHLKRFGLTQGQSMWKKESNKTNSSGRISPIQVSQITNSIHAKTQTKLQDVDQQPKLYDASYQLQFQTRRQSIDQNIDKNIASEQQIIDMGIIVKPLDKTQKKLAGPLSPAQPKSKPVSQAQELRDMTDETAIFSNNTGMQHMNHIIPLDENSSFLHSMNSSKQQEREKNRQKRLEGPLITQNDDPGSMGQESFKIGHKDEDNSSVLQNKQIQEVMSSQKKIEESWYEEKNNAINSQINPLDIVLSEEQEQNQGMVTFAKTTPDLAKIESSHFGDSKDIQVLDQGNKSIKSPQIKASIIVNSPAPSFNKGSSMLQTQTQKSVDAEKLDVVENSPVKRIKLPNVASMTQPKLYSDQQQFIESPSWQIRESHRKHRHSTSVNISNGKVANVAINSGSSRKRQSYRALAPGISYNNKDINKDIFFEANKISNKNQSKYREDAAKSRQKVGSMQFQKSNTGSKETPKNTKELSSKQQIPNFKKLDLSMQTQQIVVEDHSQNASKRGGGASTGQKNKDYIQLNKNKVSDQQQFGYLDFESQMQNNLQIGDNGKYRENLSSIMDKQPSQNDNSRSSLPSQNNHQRQTTLTTQQVLTATQKLESMQNIPSNYNRDLTNIYQHMDSVATTLNEPNRTKTSSNNWRLPMARTSGSIPGSNNNIEALRKQQSAATAGNSYNRQKSTGGYNVTDSSGPDFKVSETSAYIHQPELIIGTSSQVSVEQLDRLMAYKGVGIKPTERLRKLELQRDLLLKQINAQHYDKIIIENNEEENQKSVEDSYQISTPKQVTKDDQQEQRAYLINKLIMLQRQINAEERKMQTRYYQNYSQDNRYDEKQIAGGDSLHGGSQISGQDKLTANRNSSQSRQSQHLRDSLYQSYLLDQQSFYQQQPLQIISNAESQILDKKRNSLGKQMTRSYDRDGNDLRKKQLIKPLKEQMEQMGFKIKVSPSEQRVMNLTRNYYIEAIEAFEKLDRQRDILEGKSQSPDRSRNTQEANYRSVSQPLRSSLIFSDQIDVNPFTYSINRSDLIEDMCTLIDREIRQQVLNGQFKGLKQLESRKYISDAEKSVQRNKSIVSSILESNPTNQKQFQSQIDAYNLIEEKQILFSLIKEGKIKIKNQKDVRKQRTGSNGSNGSNGDTLYSPGTKAPANPQDFHLMKQLQQMNFEKSVLLPDIEARKRRLKRLEGMMVKGGQENVSRMQAMSEKLSGPNSVISNKRKSLQQQNTQKLILQSQDSVQSNGGSKKNFIPQGVNAIERLMMDKLNDHQVRRMSIKLEQRLSSLVEKQDLQDQDHDNHQLQDNN